MANELLELAKLIASNELQASIAKENPYFQFQEVPDATGDMALSLLTKAPGRFSNKEALAWGLGSGLLSGIFGGLGNDYQEDLTARFAKSAIGLGGSDELPGVLPGLADRYKSVFALNTLGEAEEAQKEGAQNVTAALLKAKDPAQIEQIIKVGKALKYIPDDFQMGDIASAQKVAIPVEDVAIDPNTDPLGRFEQLINDPRIKGDKVTARAILNKEIAKGQTKEKESRKREIDFAQITNAKSVIGGVFDDLKTIGTIGANIPFSDAAATFDSSKSVLMTQIQQAAKGNPSDKEVAVLKKIFPETYDTESRLEIKKQAMYKMMDLLGKGVGVTPSLKQLEASGDLPSGTTQGLSSGNTIEDRANALFAEGKSQAEIANILREEFSPKTPYG